MTTLPSVLVPRAQALAQRLFFTLVARPFLALFIGMRVEGRENLPEEDPFILVANHASHLDTLSLLSLFAAGRLRRVRPVAAADYFERNRTVSGVTHTLFNILPIARRRSAEGGDPDPIEVMVEALGAGQSLILFPEGTRGGGEGPAKFKQGVARVLERVPGVPVVPAYLVNMGRSLPKGEWIPLPVFCEVRVGTPLRPEGDAAAVTEQIRKAVMDLA